MFIACAWSPRGAETLPGQPANAGRRQAAFPWMATALPSLSCSCFASGPVSGVGISQRCRAAAPGPGNNTFHGWDSGDFFPAVRGSGGELERPPPSSLALIPQSLPAGSPEHLCSSPDPFGKFPSLHTISFQFLLLSLAPTRWFGVFFFSPPSLGIFSAEIINGASRRGC